jgi:hypothetical protein
MYMCFREEPIDLSEDLDAQRQRKPSLRFWSAAGHLRVPLQHARHMAGPVIIACDAAKPFLCTAHHEAIRSRPKGRLRPLSVGDLASIEGREGYKCNANGLRATIDKPP